ncbi:hypothetical protein C6361_17160 [Plantactinospora sp. BC1]|uniref:hypothetical protein n=1 Tax=Plantactinospora sp. BC1 TaxID=2108470 RepID=UPI000D16529A|nr:hypothetical protein [Plantactinospora sp. BC1]AVT30924.1 hypothetical protein C6361_17160 [Plantactinospora sp. BC1]
MAESAPHRMAAESSGRHRRTGSADRRDRSGRRLRLISTVGLGVGLLLLAIPFGAETLRTTLWGGGTEPEVGVPVAVADPPAPGSPVAEPTPDAALPTGTPGATPTATPGPTSRAGGAPASPPPAPSTPARPPLQEAGAAVPTPPPTTAPPSSPAAPPPPPPPAQPVLLGPDGRDGLARMMDRYCDEHVGGASWADTRGDGWECERLLLSSRTIDIDRACRDTYGDGAFAENREGRDPFGWRCFRR